MKKWYRCINDTIGCFGRKYVGDIFQLTEQEASHSLRRGNIEEIIFPHPEQEIIEEVEDVPERQAPSGLSDNKRRSRVHSTEPTLSTGMETRKRKR